MGDFRLSNCFIMSFKDFRHQINGLTERPRDRTWLAYAAEHIG